jgi:hypothetical protein
MRLLVFAFLFSSLAFADLPYGALQPFTTDGCSALGGGVEWDPNLWLHCCVQHDLKYWQGGPKQARRLADKELLSCISKVSDPIMAGFYYRGVRFWGIPSLPSSFRWGYGWPKRRGYSELTLEEGEQVLSLIPTELESYINDKRVPAETKP